MANALQDDIKPDTSKDPHYLISDKPYIAPLEGWRGIVALFVVSYHFSKLFFDEDWTPWGYLGVDFFFILSGFIISRQYEARIATHTISFRKFAVRRIARLYPLYIISIGFFLWVDHAVIAPLHKVQTMDFGWGPTFVYRVFLQLTMLGNLTVMAQPNGPVWSVSVEWIVNLAFFFIVWNLRRIPNIMLMIIIAVSTVYLINLSPHTLQSTSWSAPMIRGIIGFSLGCLIFRYHNKLPNLTSQSLHLLEKILIVLTAAALWFHDYPFIMSTDYLFQLFIFPSIITISLYRKGWIRLLFSLPLMTYLGRISYSIYLLHYPLAYMMEYTPSIHNMFGPKPHLGIAYICVLLTLSTFSYVLIETPGRYIGKKISQRWS